MTQRPASPSARRERLFAALALALGIAAPLLALEAGLRLFPPAWLEARMHEMAVATPGGASSDRGWPTEIAGQVFHRFVPGAGFTVAHREYRHEVRIDEWGGRATPYRPDQTRLLPFMGDSFTFGVGVADGETFVARIAPRFRSRLLNLGVTGAALHNQLDTLELRHDELGRPASYVFALFMGNDLDDLRERYEPTAASAAVAREPPARGWPWRANLFALRNPVLKRLHTVQFVRQRILAAINRAGTAGFMQPVFLAMRGDLPYLETSLSYLARELDRLERLERALGFRAVFVLIPDVYQLDRRRRTWKARIYGLDPARLHPERIAAGIAARLDARGIRHLDLGPCLSAAPVDGLYYIHDTHFTAAGHARAAECILESALQLWAEGPAQPSRP